MVPDPELRVGSCRRCRALDAREAAVQDEPSGVQRLKAVAAKSAALRTCASGKAESRGRLTGPGRQDPVSGVEVSSVLL